MEPIKKCAESIYFILLVIDVLNTYTLITTKRIRGNSHQFLTKALQKAIMTRSRLKNILD